MKHHVIGLTIVSLIILAAVLLFAEPFPPTERYRAPTYRASSPCECTYIEDTDADLETVGYGMEWGPREARQAVMVWDHCGAFRMRWRQYGPPEDQLDRQGPLVAEVDSLLPQAVYEFLRNELLDPAECVVWRPGGGGTP